MLTRCVYTRKGTVQSLRSRDRVPQLTGLRLKRYFVVGPMNAKVGEFDHDGWKKKKFYYRSTLIAYKITKVLNLDS